MIHSGGGLSGPAPSVRPSPRVTSPPRPGSPPMANFDAETLAEQAVLLGLVTREQMREARNDAEDGSQEALTRSLMRKQLLTSWQLDRLIKGENSGYFFGGCK